MLTVAAAEEAEEITDLGGGVPVCLCVDDKTRIDPSQLFCQAVTNFASDYANSSSTEWIEAACKSEGENETARDSRTERHRTNKRLRARRTGGETEAIS